MCSHGTCVVPGDCKDDNDCSSDMYCSDDGKCAPWEKDPDGFDAVCYRDEPIAPSIACSFTQAPAGDPFPEHLHVNATPMVARFDPNGPPYVVAPFVPGHKDKPTEADPSKGIIRVLRGDDCTLVANLGGVDLDQDNSEDYVHGTAPVALGDVDGDGDVDIVAHEAEGGMLVFAYNKPSFSLYAKSAEPKSFPYGGDCPNCSLRFSGSSLHDLDNDGIPEVIRDGLVMNTKGEPLALRPNSYGGNASGTTPVFADLDGNGLAELIAGHAIWEYELGNWTKDKYFSGDLPGSVAIADLGAYGSGPSSAAEIIVISEAPGIGKATIYAADSTPVLEVKTSAGFQRGKPAMADFDGDGLLEIGISGQWVMMIDLDCGSNPRPGGVCVQGSCDYFNDNKCPDGVAWMADIQDPAAIHMAAAFDFDSNGSFELVIDDVCYLRVFDGASGQVLFSESSRGVDSYSGAVVVDASGDGKANIVSAMSLRRDGWYEVSCGAHPDNLLAGARCQSGSDCFSGVCSKGFCRCASHADCCSAKDLSTCVEQGRVCKDPPLETPGEGKTCRSAPQPTPEAGIRIYQQDSWPSTRQIWNQQAYSFTNVNDDGTIPKTSAWKKHWLDKKTNGYRLNPAGQLPPAASIADVTAGATDEFVCGNKEALLSAPICNRGAETVPAGLKVSFMAGKSLACSTSTTKDLDKNSCEKVSCSWSAVPQSVADAVDVAVIADSDDQVIECKESNNSGVVLKVFCPPAG